MKKLYSTAIFLIVIQICSNRELAKKIGENPCPPVDPKLNKINKMNYINSTPTELAIQQRCIDILNQTNFCQVQARLIGEPVSYTRVKRCYHIATGFIVGGQRAKAKEFRHQALLECGSNSDNSRVNPSRGGTLISDEWVMTAAHCVWCDKNSNQVERVKLGILKRTENRPEDIYGVKRIRKYPHYNRSSRNHDIALLQLDRKVRFSENIVPACLPYKDIEPENAIATGWGATEDVVGIDMPEELMKVTLKKGNQCQDYERNTKLCYGGNGVDTCRGDSGGPLQIQNSEIYCTYTVFGITSFGQGCGNDVASGVYTRVHHYIDWILETVWPNNDSNGN